MRKMFLLTALASCSATFAQQPRIFTYDASGNRIAMQITSENAPEASLFNADDTVNEDTASFDVTETTGIVSVWVGVKHNGVTYRYGHSNKHIHNATQNYIHQKFGKGPYFKNDEPYFKTGFYSMQGRTNPLSLFY